MGALAIDPLTTVGYGAALEAWGCLQHNVPGPFRVWCDLRRAPTWLVGLAPVLAPKPWAGAPDEFVPAAAVMQAPPPPSTGFRGGVALVANDWTRHYWLGLIQSHSQSTPEGFRWLVSTEPDLVWPFVSDPHGARPRVEALTRHILNTSELTRAVERSLLNDLSVGLPELAHQLGVSRRVVQRTLKADGVSLVTLRNTLRLARARHLMARNVSGKSVATQCGFASVAHFGAWYKQQSAHSTVAGPLDPELDHSGDDFSNGSGDDAGIEPGNPSTRTTRGDPHGAPYGDPPASNAGAPGFVAAAPTQAPGPEAGADLAGWRWVSEEALGRGVGLTVCRVTENFFVWVRTPEDPSRPVLAGTYCAASIQARDLEAYMPSWLHLNANVTRPFRVVCEVSRTLALMIDAPEYWLTQANMGHDIMATTVSPLMQALAVRVADNWTALWFRGLFEGATWPFWQCTDRATLFKQVQADAGEEADVSALYAALDARTATAFAIEQQLAASPGLDLNAIAAHLRCSPRSIQRTLAQTGQTFAGIRDRVRRSLAERALAEGTKVEVVSAEVGFASPSHFRHWLQRDQAAKV